MHIYILLVRIAALFGHKKARLLLAGQKAAKEVMTAYAAVPVSDTSGDQRPKTIWFHAASVGEFEQARPLIEKLAGSNKQSKITVTFFSPSGYEARKNYPLAEKVMYLPFATRKNAKRFLDTFRPDIAIFIKYDFWPAYLRELKKRDIPTYLVSGIFRKEQLFFRWYGWWYRKLLECFTMLFVQDEESAALLERLSVTDYGLRVMIAGDTRFDRVAAINNNQSSINNQHLSAFAVGKVIVAGSTWHPDEVLLARYIEEHEDVRLILVPHEIDEARLHDVFNTFQGRLVRFTEATDLNIRHVRVLVVDTMGMLSKLYRLGQAAYVGGGFGVGIHNTLEPAVYGMPVVFGHNYEHFREAKGLVACGAGLPVSNYAEFEAAMDKALSEHESLGAKATEYIQSELGATDKILNNLTI